MTVRRFFCDNTSCTKVTFAQRLDGLAPPHAQRTDLLRSNLEAIALLLAGRAGARLAERLGIRTGYSSLLRRIRALPDPAIPIVPVLGVDDFAFRRGRTHGTILVDMAMRRPIDLFDGRESKSLQAWLRTHPEVEVICRDRASAYADAARRAAPNAVQVADRFHLWQNLTQAIETCILRHRDVLTEPLIAPDQHEPEHNQPGPDAPDDPEPVGRMAERYRTKHKIVHDLLEQGYSQRAICGHLHWGRDTVHRYAKAESWQDLVVKQRQKPSKLDPFKAYLHAEWATGRTNVIELCAEITAMGYNGSYSTVADYLALHRPDLPEPAPLAKIAPPSVREVTGWLTRHPDHLGEGERLKLKALLARSRPLEEAHELVKSFAAMLTGLTGDDLPAWIETARACQHPSLRRFAGGLIKDLDAVTAGLSLPHSSGAVEGNVNRLKMIKRKLYGRANLDLLRKLVLLSG